MLGEDPTAASQANLPSCSLVGDKLIYIFRRSDASAYLNPVVQIAPTLDTAIWTQVTTGIVVDADYYAPGIARVTVTIPRPLAAKGFARLAVSIP